MVGEGEVKRPTLERVRDVRMRYDLRDYIAQELRFETRSSRGRYIQVKCPFHEDNDPSMAVYERNYYCHGCRAHGDIIDWIRHRDGSNFFTALEMLEGIGSHQAGPGVRPWVVQSEHEVQSTVGADRLRSTLASIIKAGMENMMGSPAAIYCQSRGWGRNVQDAYRLGYVDIHSEDLGFFGGKDSFEEIGLLYKSGHPWVSRRLLIPLLDTSGNPVALATRTLGGDDGPRYINSRRSALFRRDEMIYGSSGSRCRSSRTSWLSRGMPTFGPCIARECRRSLSCLTACLSSSTTGSPAMRGGHASGSSWHSMVTPQGKKGSNSVGPDWQPRTCPSLGCGSGTGLMSRRSSKNRASGPSRACSHTLKEVHDGEVQRRGA